MRNVMLIFAGAMALFAATCYLFLRGYSQAAAEVQVGACFLFSCGSFFFAYNVGRARREMKRTREKIDAIMENQEFTIREKFSAISKLPGVEMEMRKIRASEEPTEE